MLSILIPTYAYSAVDLVKELHQQCTKLNIPFEVLCFDNGSKTEVDVVNNQINQLENCTFKALEKNGGRSKIRNVLAQKATYNWLLFLDADTMPVNQKFIENYFHCCSSKSQVTFGGLAYYDEKPNDEFMLRWTYGHAREAIPLKRRLKSPSTSFTSANFLIEKDLLLRFPFNETLVEYGFEDALLAQELSQKGIKINQLDNPVYHLGLDKNEVFIEKTKHAVKNMHQLWLMGKMNTKSIGLFNAFNVVRRLKMTGLIHYLYAKYEHQLQLNLLSKKPSLSVYDLFKLGYLCSLISEKR